MHRPVADDDRVKCSACGFWNDPETAPQGGQFYHKTGTKVVDGVTWYYDNNGSQGCAFCGSPAWRSGASLGDFSGWWKKRH